MPTLKFILVYVLFYIHKLLFTSYNLIILQMHFGSRRWNKEEIRRLPLIDSMKVLEYFQCDIDRVRRVQL